MLLKVCFFCGYCLKPRGNLITLVVHGLLANNKTGRVNVFEGLFEINEFGYFRDSVYKRKHPRNRPCTIIDEVVALISFSLKSVFLWQQTIYDRNDMIWAIVLLSQVGNELASDQVKPYYLLQYVV